MFGARDFDWLGSRLVWGLDEGASKEVPVPQAGALLSRMWADTLRLSATAASDGGLFPLC
ncbi:hypothetical protein RSSM_04585 [Rhodopirellula sallentina SM41]|uniref:Uncharacterized protein n=1 Tax=Rhodopirellula sallentina SM41 TaxID=1263870 RepID=M5U7Y4_9BACT|nr:hypothetical protein RSSM_04585 [Rhodopirellula sallentina SM41]